MRYAPYAVLLVVAAVVAVGLAAYAWSRRRAPGAKEILVLSAAVFVWSLAYAAEIPSPGLGTKILWAKVEYLGITAAPVAWFAFALRYTGRGGWLTRRNLALLAAVPLITLLLVATNEAHGLVWSRTRLAASGEMLAVEHGPWFWVHWAYSYLLLLGGTLFLLSALARAGTLYRRQGVPLLIAVAAPWIGNGMYVLGLNPLPLLDLTPFAFLISGVAIAWGFLRRGFLELVPVARDALVEGMADGVIVADRRGRIVDVNPAARRILGDADPVGANLRGASPKLGALLDKPEAAGEEIALGDGERVYDLALSTLRDGEGRGTGYLLVLRDATGRKRAEEELRESEELYRAVVEQAAEGIFLFDAETKRVIEANAAFAGLLGYTVEELSGMEIYAFIDHDRASIDANVRRVVGEGSASVGERRYRRRDGRVLDFEVSAARISYGGKQALCAVARDITERKEAERRLRASEAELRALFSSMTDVIFVLDREGRILKVAPTDPSLLYKPSEDVLGKTLHEIFPGERADGFLDAIRRTLRSGETTEIEYSLPIDGREVHFAGTVSPMLEDSVVFVARDVTDRKRAETRLREAEARFRTLVEQIPAVVYVEDIETQATLYDSPQIETLLGYPADTYEKDPYYWEKILHPEDRERVMAAEVEARGSGGFRLEYRVFAADGRVVWVRDEAQVVRDEQGNPRFWQGVIFDATEEKRAEEELVRQKAELARSNAELEQFAYLVAHDLRAPLRGIDGFAHILIEDYAEKLGEEGRDLLLRVRDAARRMGTLIDDLLDLSRLARAPMRRERVDIGAIAGEIAAELGRAEPDREVEFKVSGDLVAEGDGRLLRIALTNLLDNAWKFTRGRPDARIEVGRGERDGGTFFYVRDNGVGFDMRYAGKLFGAFQRLHGPGEFEGTGIGLAAVARVVERHGGRVWAEGAVGEGATFYFTL